MIAKLLLDKGVDVNAQDTDVDDEGEEYSSAHALEAASSRGHEQVVVLLLKKGANGNARYEQIGNATLR